MVDATTHAALIALIEPEAAALGFDLVRVRWFGGDDPTLQIMAERPATGQLSIDDCAALSRRISDLFDTLEADGRDPVPDAYRLEVSSPGIDRPLTRLKDFAAWVGFEARITMAEGAATTGGRKTLSGPIAAVDGDVIRLDDRKVGLVELLLPNIAQAKLLLTDKLIAATAPLSVEGADEVETSEEED